MMGRPMLDVDLAKLLADERNRESAQDALDRRRYFAAMAHYELRLVVRSVVVLAGATIAMLLVTGLDSRAIILAAGAALALFILLIAISFAQYRRELGAARRQFDADMAKGN